MTSPDHIARVADQLTTSERDLLLGRCEGWGSWMFSAGQHMVSLGLGSERNGSIFFDTQLGEDVRNHLLSQDKTQ